MGTRQASYSIIWIHTNCTKNNYELNNDGNTCTHRTPRVKTAGFEQRNTAQQTQMVVHNYLYKIWGELRNKNLH